MARVPHLSGNIVFSGFKIFLLGALCISVVQNLTFSAKLLQPQNYVDLSLLPTLS